MPGPPILRRSSPVRRIVVSTPRRAVKPKRPPFVTGAVVAEKQDQRVLEVARRLQVLDNLPHADDRPVPPSPQTPPSGGPDRAGGLRRANPRQGSVSRSIRWRCRRGRPARSNAASIVQCSPSTSPSFCIRAKRSFAQHVPTAPVGRFVLVRSLGRRLNGKVWRRMAEEQKPRLAAARCPWRMNSNAYWLNTSVA